MLAELRARASPVPLVPADARDFWNLPAELVKAGELLMAVPDELRARRFVDGSPVVRDEIWAVATAPEAAHPGGMLARGETEASRGEARPRRRARPGLTPI